MGMWNRYRTFEDFERQELWSSDLAPGALAGLDDWGVRAPGRANPADDDVEQDFDVEEFDAGPT